MQTRVMLICSEPVSTATKLKFVKVYTSVSNCQLAVISLHLEKKTKVTAGYDYVCHSEYFELHFASIMSLTCCFLDVYYVTNMLFF